MKTLTFTELTTSELKAAIREELHAVLADFKQSPTLLIEDDMGGIELAIQITGLAKPTIYSLVCDRKIPHSKRGKRLYFSRQELVQWLKAGKRKTQDELKEEAVQYGEGSRK